MKKKKIAFKDSSVTIKWADIENWADDIYSAELYAVCNHKDKNKAEKILTKYGLSEDELGEIYHYNLIRYLSDIICGLSQIITKNESEKESFRMSIDYFVKELKSL
jgi:hypothetical protein